nr:MAG TPA: hypothetical protein [Caudoviricetes sp.]
MVSLFSPNFNILYNKKMYLYISLIINIFFFELKFFYIFLIIL